MNTIELQKQMIIQKKYQEMSLVRARDALLMFATWGTWTYVLWFLYESSEELFTRNVLIHWQMDDVFLGLGLVCLTQFVCVYAREFLLGRQRRQD